MAEGVIIADTEGKFLFCSDAVRSVLSLGRKDFLQSWRQVQDWFRADGISPYAYEELPATLALAGVVVPETEVVVRTAQQPAGIWISVQANPLPNASGTVCGSIVIFRDIIQKRQRDAQIRILASGVEKTADSIIITDSKAAIEYVNPAFVNTTGFTMEEVVGQTPMVLKSGAHDDAFYANLWNTIVSGQIFRSTMINRKKNGEIFVAEQTITPMTDSTGKITHFVTVIKDVTELQKFQEQQFQMNLARAVQQQFYRIPPPTIEGFDLAGAAFPADEIGGDYFDFVRLPNDCLGIAIGDVSGHGVSAALMMVELRAYLRAYAQRTSDVSEILSLVNNKLASDLESGCYATLIFCRLDPSSGTLIFANAGHTPGFVLDPGGSIKATLNSTDVPLGFFPDHTFQIGAPIKLQSGDILSLLTDGITDAESPDKRMFGADSALRSIQASRRESAKSIVEILFRAVREFSDELPQVDDITAVICKVAGLAH
jgi:sigma-B regulation protein RsbU (phosphoserine phosphatase)